MFTQSQYLSDSHLDNPEIFSWPIDRNRAAFIRDSFLEQVLNFYKSKEDFSEFVQYYPVLCMYWSAHMLQSYSALTLQKSSMDNLTLVDPVQNAILKGQKIPNPAYLIQLEKGVKDIKPYLKPLRFLKHAIKKKEAIKRKSAFLIDFKRDVIVTTTGPLIYKHAQQSEKQVFYQNQALWFYPLKNGQNLDYTLAQKDARNLWSIVVQSFGEQAYLLKEKGLEDWFLNIFQKSLSLCHAYSQRLHENKNKLPQHLWIGTGAALWDRILKNAVSQNGGEVSGHDHGAGVGHLISKSRTLSECFACKNFVSFGDKDHFYESIYTPFLINEAPEVSKIGQKKNFNAPHIKLKTGKKILIMPSAPEAKIPRFIGAAMEPIQADFLNRLFFKLQKDGYDVYVKPHPELTPLIHDEYFINNGGHVLRGNLKEAYDLCDIVLFQHIHSTTFKEAFEHGKHIAFIDMQYDEWTPEAYKAVRQRCSAIPMHYDEKNRIQINWDNLTQQLEECRTLDDPSFMNMFFS